MEIGATYSHLNGMEYLMVHHAELWDEVLEVIAGVDAHACKNKVSKERTMKGKMLYSPGDMNRAFRFRFGNAGWREQRDTFWVTKDEKVARKISGQSPEVQKATIEKAGYVPIMSYNQTDFVKGRVAVEVQFGKYAFVAHDLFVKHMSFYVSGVIDVGIEVLPMKSMEREMSSGVPYYERDLMNVVRQGRGVPAVPLVLIGVTP